MDQQLDPNDALAIARDARHRLAARATTPWWYPPLYGLGCGAIVASYALPVPLIAVGVLASLALLLATYVTWQRRSGLSVNGYRRGRTWITIPLVIVFIAVALLATWLRFEQRIVWAPIVLGGLLAVIAGGASAAWDKAWRADILSGA